MSKNFWTMISIFTLKPEELFHWVSYRSFSTLFSILIDDFTTLLNFIDFGFWRLVDN